MGPAACNTASARWPGAPRAARGARWARLRSRRSLQYRGGQVHFQGRAWGLWDSYGLAQYSLRAGCFAEDARGRWYLNVTVEVVPQPQCGTGDSLGIDLGLKAFAGFSDDALDNVEARRFYRAREPALARAQRAHKRQRIKALHATIANRRTDFLHKLSTELVHRYGAIIGNVNAAALARTTQAESVLDAGWSALRTMLRYKCADAGPWLDEVDQAYSTATCSVCNSRTGPLGREGLRIREWTCSACGTTHDRDRRFPAGWAIR
jgi:putative transposase